MQFGIVLKTSQTTIIACPRHDCLLLWWQARKAGHADGAGKETDEAEEMLRLNKPLAQFISPVTHLVYFIDFLYKTFC